MKKNKCDNCFIGLESGIYRVIREDDRDILISTSYFNYCPYCRS